METNVAIHHFGNASNLAQALGVSKAAISQWGQKVPQLRAYQIERITNGKLKAEEPELKQAS